MVLVAIEELSKVCATTGLILAVQELGSLGIKLAGTEEQKQRFLPRLATGEWLAAYALTEPGSGSDSAAMRTEARRDGDEYVLNGGKRFITNAGVAHVYTVFAKTDPEAGHSRHLGVRRRGRRARVRGRPHRAEDGHQGLDDRRDLLQRLRIPAENLLGEEGEGFKIAMRILDRSRPGIGAQGLGLAQGATDYALEYAKSARDDGQADRPAPADRRPCSPTWRRSARRRAGCSTRSGMMIDEGADRRRADEDLGDGEALLHRRRDGGHDRRRADPRRLRLHAGVSRSSA